MTYYVKEIPEGRRLDHAVAELVMGWLPVNGDYLGYWYQVPEGDPDRDLFGSADAPPPYSSDLTQAWKVVARLQSLGWKVRIEELTANEHRYLVEFSFEDTTGFTFRSAGGDNVPSTICVAALDPWEGDECYELRPLIIPPVQESR